MANYVYVTQKYDWAYQEGNVTIYWLIIDVIHSMITINRISKRNDVCWLINCMWVYITQRRDWTYQEGHAIIYLLIIDVVYSSILTR